MSLQLLFVAIVLASTPLLWLISKPWRGRLMLSVTLLTLAWIAPVSIAIMLATAILQWMIWKKGWQQLSSVAMAATLVSPLTPLLFFKVAAASSHWLIPLGLSYYAFRQIHVAFEVYKKQLNVDTLWDYLQYLLFLPAFLVGPIHRMPEFSRSMRRQKWDAALFSEGLERILYGLVKIFFLGNYLFTNQGGKLVEMADNSGAKVYLGMMSFTGNAYTQFAGFSDLAIGMGMLWGVRIIENFNHPFMATNMQDFWQRWHISLSTWCRDYVFHPVNAWSRNRWMALILSMLVLALWHELSLRYILWGSFHATLILVTVRARTALPALSNFVNSHKWGKWMGRIWVIHLFAASCLLIGALENVNIDHPLIKLLK